MESPILWASDVGKASGGAPQPSGGLTAGSVVLGPWTAEACVLLKVLTGVQSSTRKHLISVRGAQTAAHMGLGGAQTGFRCRCGLVQRTQMSLCAGEERKSKPDRRAPEVDVRSWRGRRQTLELLKQAGDQRQKLLGMF